jgi:hypothetical protein
VGGVFAAEGAVFAHFEFFRGVFLVLVGVVVALFALVAPECDLDSCVSHAFGTSLSI